MTKHPETGPNHNLTDWVRHHDKYDEDGFVDPTGDYRAASATVTPRHSSANYGTAKEPHSCDTCC